MIQIVHNPTRSNSKFCDKYPVSDLILSSEHHKYLAFDLFTNYMSDNCVISTRRH